MLTVVQRAALRCQLCRQNQPGRANLVGFYQPHMVAPQSLWEMSVDLVTSLPCVYYQGREADTILTIFDMFSHGVNDVNFRATGMDILAVLDRRVYQQFGVFGDL